MNDQWHPLGEELLRFTLDEYLLESLRLCRRLGEEEALEEAPLAHLQLLNQ